jgi:hypothetical protein
MTALPPLEHKKLCRSCGAPVIWRKHNETGKPLIIDATPVANGNIVLLEDGEHYRILHQPAVRETYEGDRYIAHWATCPDAAKWKGKKD